MKDTVLPTEKKLYIISSIRKKREKDKWIKWSYNFMTWLPTKKDKNFLSGGARSQAQQKNYATFTDVLNEGIKRSTFWVVTTVRSILSNQIGDILEWTKKPWPSLFNSQIKRKNFWWPLAINEYIWMGSYFNTNMQTQKKKVIRYLIRQIPKCLL